MLTRIDLSTTQPAKIRYLESDYKVLSGGDHVVCAVTGTAIPLDELKYWSWERQEPYVDHLAALKAELAARDKA